MFIFGGRTLGTLGGLACALALTLLLGACATPRGAAADLAERAERGGAQAPGGTRVCMTYGPSLDDRRCGFGQALKAESAVQQALSQGAF
jgi:hypothetical protein